MAVWNAFTMLQFRAYSSLWRTPVLSQKSEDKLTALLLRLKKPRKPLNAYMKFTLDKRAQLQKENPGSSVSEISKLTAKLWSELSEKEKSSYYLQSSMEQQEYKSLMEDYINQIDAFENKDLLSGGSKFNTEDKKLLGKPGKPSSPFFTFRASLKKASPDAPLLQTEVMKKWNSPNNKERQKIEEEYKKEVQKYNKELVEWEEKMYQKGYVKLVRRAMLHSLREKYGQPKIK